MTARVAVLETSPKAEALTSVLESMGRLFADIKADREPVLAEPIPAWLADRRLQQVGLSAAKVAEMIPDEAMRRLEEH